MAPARAGAFALEAAMGPFEASAGGRDGPADALREAMGPFGVAPPPRAPDPGHAGAAPTAPYGLERPEEDGPGLEQAMAPFASTAAAAGSVRRRALLVGADYSGDAGLHGRAGETVLRFARLLVSLGWSAEPDAMRLLTDSTRVSPTRNELRAALRWLGSDAAPGDERLLLYAGRCDEVPAGTPQAGSPALMPADYRAAGLVTGADILAMLQLPSGCSLTAVVDCCHGGGGAAALDVLFGDATPFVYRAGSDTPRAPARARSRPDADVVMLCTTADQSRDFGGASGRGCVWALCRALAEGNQPVAQLLASMNGALQAAAQHYGLMQERPCMCCSQRQDPASYRLCSFGSGEPAHAEHHTLPAEGFAEWQPTGGGAQPRFGLAVHAEALRRAEQLRSDVRGRSAGAVYADSDSDGPAPSAIRAVLEHAVAAGLPPLALFKVGDEVSFVAEDGFEAVGTVIAVDGPQCYVSSADAGDLWLDSAELRHCNALPRPLPADHLQALRLLCATAAGGAGASADPPVVVMRLTRAVDPASLVDQLAAWGGEAPAGVELLQVQRTEPAGTAAMFRFVSARAAQATKAVFAAASRGSAGDLSAAVGYVGLRGSQQAAVAEPRREMELCTDASASALTESSVALGSPTPDATSVEVDWDDSVDEARGPDDSPESDYVELTGTMPDRPLALLQALATLMQVQPSRLRMSYCSAGKVGVQVFGGADSQAVASAFAARGSSDVTARLRGTVVDRIELVPTQPWRRRAVLPAGSGSGLQLSDSCVLLGCAAGSAAEAAGLGAFSGWYCSCAPSSSAGLSDVVVEHRPALLCVDGGTGSAVELRCCRGRVAFRVDGDWRHPACSVIADRALQKLPGTRPGPARGWVALQQRWGPPHVITPGERAMDEFESMCRRGGVELLAAVGSAAELAAAAAALAVTSAASVRARSAWRAELPVCFPPGFSLGPAADWLRAAYTSVVQWVAHGGDCGSGVYSAECLCYCGDDPIGADAPTRMMLALPLRVKAGGGTLALTPRPGSAVHQAARCGVKGMPAADQPVVVAGHGPVLCSRTGRVVATRPYALMPADRTVPARSGGVQHRLRFCTWLQGCGAQPKVPAEVTAAALLI